MQPQTIADVLENKSLREVLGASPSATVAEAAAQMARAGVGALVVRDGSGPVQGIFTERDLLVRVVAAGRDPAATRLADVMTAAVRAVEADTTTLEALRLMVEHRYRHLLVLDGMRATGLVSVRDLMHAQLLGEAAPPHEGRADVLRARVEDALETVRARLPGAA